VDKKVLGNISKLKSSRKRTIGEECKTRGGGYPAHKILKKKEMDEGEANGRKPVSRITRAEAIVKKQGLDCRVFQAEKKKGTEPLKQG